MTGRVDRAELISSLSREFALEASTDGVVTWCDERARRLLGIDAGRPLEEALAPGSEDKARRLLASAATPGERELFFMIDGEATSTCVRTASGADGATLILGAVGTGERASTITRMGAAMSELSTLQRESERQQRELDVRRKEVHDLRGSLDDSGRGMQSLFVELEEQSHTLREEAEVRGRVVANLTHELRTPLSSIVGLAELLESRVDGDLTSEQAKQIGFIRRAAEDLLVLASDMLDIARSESGALRVRDDAFTLEELLGTLRGQLRPLAPQDGPVALVIDEPADASQTLHTDRGKIAQILRNLVTNALKFTESGSVHVSAQAIDGGRVMFSVTDTGIGIAPDDLERVFEEFVQIDNPLQRKAKGAGLGLTLSRRLATRLGGELTASSVPGHGATFTLVVPVMHPDVRELQRLEERARAGDDGRAPVLVLEDDVRALFLYERYLSEAGFRAIPARSVGTARELLRTIRPAAVVLDVLLEGETSWTFLTELKSNPETRDIPALVVTVMDRERKARALGADEFHVKPMDRGWLLGRLEALAPSRNAARVLHIDDDEMARYLMRRHLAGTTYQLAEASDASEGIRLARALLPDIIVLDFVLGATTALEVLDELKSDPATRGIPVILSTSKELTPHERERIAADTAAILPKDRLTREVAIARLREALRTATARHDATAARVTGGVRAPSLPVARTGEPEGVR